MEESNKGFQPLRLLSPCRRRRRRRRSPWCVLRSPRCFVAARSACFTAAYSHSIVLWPPPSGFRIRQRPFQGRMMFSFSILRGSHRNPLCAIVPMGFRFLIYRVGKQRFLDPFVLELRHCPRLVCLLLDLFSALLVFQLAVERERNLFFFPLILYMLVPLLSLSLMTGHPPLHVVPIKTKWFVSYPFGCILLP